MKDKFEYSEKQFYSKLFVELSARIKCHEEKLRIDDSQIACAIRRLIHSLKTISHHYKASKEAALTLIQKVTDSSDDVFQLIIQRLNKSGKIHNRMEAAAIIIHACSELRLLAVGDEKFYKTHEEFFSMLNPLDRKAFMQIVSQTTATHIQGDLLGKDRLQHFAPEDKTIKIIKTQTVFFKENTEVIPAATDTLPTSKASFLKMIEDINGSSHDPNTLKCALLRQQEVLKDFFAKFTQLDDLEKAAVLNTICSKTKKTENTSHGAS